jgi:hypothetical protein
MFQLLPSNVNHGFLEIDSFFIVHANANNQEYLTETEKDLAGSQTSPISTKGKHSCT